MEIKQSTATYALVFFMADSTDHVTGKTGLSPTVVLSKNGGTFAPPAGAVTEIANGFYKVSGNATDSGTLGQLCLYATAAGADPTPMQFEVVANLEADSYLRLGAPAASSIAEDIYNVDSEVGTIGATVNSTNAIVGSATYGCAALKTLIDTVDTVVDAVKAVTDNLPDSGALSDLPVLAARLSAARAGFLDELSSANLPADVAGVPAAVRTELATELGRIDTTIGSRASTAKLLAYVQLLARSDAAIANDLVSELAEINTNEGTGAGAFRSINEDSIQLASQEVVAALALLVDGTEGLAAIKTAVDGITPLDAAGMRSALGMAAADLDTQLDAILAASPTAAAIADAVHDEAVEGAFTFRQLTRLMAAVLVGKMSGGGGSTLTFRDVNDTVDRVVATVDGSSNRTAITKTAT